MSGLHLHCRSHQYGWCGSSLVCYCSRSRWNASAILYYPFFKIADNQSYEEEQAIATEHNAA